MLALPGQATPKQDSFGSVAGSETSSPMAQLLALCSAATPASTPSRTLLEGKLVMSGQIQLFDELGSGEFGSVYRGKDTKTSSNGDAHEQYAVKCILKAAMFVDWDVDGTESDISLVAEIRLHCRVADHPNVVSVLALDEDEEHYYMILELADEDLFAPVLQRCEFEGKDELVKRIFGDILAAVEYCHSKGVFHRDLKPENILLVKEKGEGYSGWTAKLADFGLATSQPFSEDFRVGTMSYVSPECFGGWYPYDHAANDVWALGLILFNLVSGDITKWREPSRRDEGFEDFVKEPTSIRPEGITDDVFCIILAALDLDPESRLTVSEMSEAMGAIDRVFLADL